MDSKQNEKEKKAYVSLYKKNALPYSLALLAILVELVYVIMILDVMNVGYLMGVTVMINIVLLFALFNCAVKINLYNRTWSLIAIGIGVYMLVRMGILVPFVLKPYGRQFIIAIADIAGGVLLITAGILSADRTTRRKKLQDKLNQ